MATIGILNRTPGPLFLDVPSAQNHDEDPLGDLLSNVDLTRDISPGEAVKLTLAMEIARRAESEGIRRASESALRRAKNTVDLWPAYVGEGQPEHVNHVDIDAWRKLERMPSVAARLSTGELRVTHGSAPF